MKFLIIDDDITSRRIIENTISNYGTCSWAKTGDEGIKMFSSALEDKDPYSFITLDFILPAINGSQVYTQLRKIEDTLKQLNNKKTHILMVTTQSNMESVMESLSVGCSDYLVKPFEPDQLVNKLISIGALPQDVNAGTQDDEMSKIFMIELGKRIQLLNSFIKENNIDEVQKIGHKLHGTGTTYGFSNVSSIGKDIEDAATEGNWTKIFNRVKSLEIFYRRNNS